jgi:Amt family ammonium transporter
MAMFYVINLFGVLRVSDEGEMQGIDLHEHGVPAYPEYALHASATPGGAPAFVDQNYAPVATPSLSTNFAASRKVG